MHDSNFTYLFLSETGSFPSGTTTPFTLSVPHDLHFRQVLVAFYSGTTYTDITLQLWEKASVSIAGTPQQGVNLRAEIPLWKRTTSGLGFVPVDFSFIGKQPGNASGMHFVDEGHIQIVSGFAGQPEFSRQLELDTDAGAMSIQVLSPQFPSIGGTLFFAVTSSRYPVKTHQEFHF